MSRCMHPLRPWPAVLTSLVSVVAMSACAHATSPAGLGPSALTVSQTMPATSPARDAAPFPARLATATLPDATADVNPARAVRVIDADPIARAITRYRATGVAEPVRVGGVLVLPFGHGEPVLACAVLRVCVLELEPGERLVNDPIAGDQARWIIETARAGAEGTSTLVVVKPKQCDITTNLVVSTDRRVYDLTLDAPACAKHTTNPKPTVAQQYTEHLRFYYPDDSARVIAIAPTGPGTRTTSAPSAADERAVVNRDYRIVRHRRGPFGLFGTAPLGFPWTPAAIWDDGAHVTIVLPPAAEHDAAPVLYAEEDDGSRTIVNYVLRDGRIVTDRTFRRALLVIRSGNRERRLEIENHAWGRSPASSGGRDVAARAGTPAGGR